MSTYDFSTSYTTLPHNLIKEKLLDLIERTFYKKEGKLYLACNDKKVFFNSADHYSGYDLWSAHLSGPSIKRKVSYTLLVIIRKQFSLLQTIIEDITFGLFRMYVTPYRFSCTIFILGLALSYTDKLLVFRWVQIVLFGGLFVPSLLSKGDCIYK